MPTCVPRLRPFRLNVDLPTLFGGVTDLTVGWTAATGAAFNAHDVRRFQLTTAADQLGLGERVVSLTDQQHLLRDGTNVLAIHGLNVAVDDDDFLIRPELIGSIRTSSAPRSTTCAADAGRDQRCGR